MINQFLKTISDPRINKKNVLICLVSGVIATYIFMAIIYDRQIESLKTEKLHLQNEIKRLEKKIQFSSHLSTKKQTVDCEKIELLIKKKKAEIVSKEGQFFAASSISLMKKSTKYENPNSLYNIRARELKDLQTQLDSLNQKLIECLAK